MPLEKSTLEIPIAAGIAENVDPKVLPPGALVVQHNSRLTKIGEVRKAFGWRSLTSDVSLPPTLAAGTRGADEWRGDKDSFYSRNSSGTSEQRIAEWQQVRIDEWPLQTLDGYTVLSFDVAADTTGQWACVIYLLANSDPVAGNVHIRCMVQVLDVARGHYSLPYEVDAWNVAALIAAPPVKVIFSGGTTAHVLWLATNVTSLRMRKIACPAWDPNETPFISTLTAACRVSFDAAYNSYKDRITVVWNDTANPAQYYLKEYNPSTYANTSSSTWIDAGTTGAYLGKSIGIAIGYGATWPSLVWIGYCTSVVNQIVRATAFEMSFYSQPVAPTTLWTQLTTESKWMVGILPNDSAETALYYFTGYVPTSGGAYELWTNETSIDLAGVAAAPVKQYACGMASAPFARYGEAQTKPWIWMFNDEGLDANLSRRRTAVLCSIHGTNHGGSFSSVRNNLSPLPFATVGERVTTANTGVVGLLPATLVNVSTTESNSIFWGTIIANRASTDPFASQSLLVVRATFDAQELGTMTDINSVNVIAAGSASVFDSNRCYEAGFIQRPQVLAATLAGGGSFAAGDYWYKATYEFIDTQGNRHWSEPSEAFKISPALNNKATVYIRPLTITRRDDGNWWAQECAVRVVLYRTEAGSTIAGPYYLQSSMPNVINASVAEITFTDTGASVATGERLYTTGGNFVDVSPPAARHVCAHSDRIWLMCGSELWYSKRRVAGEAPRFCDEFVLQAPEAEVWTGIASLDDKLIAFTAEDTFAVLGRGPEDDGSGAPFELQKLGSKIGCISPKSVCATPFGVMRISRHGLHMLDRSLTEQDIGEPIVETIASFPTATSAVYLDAQQEARFTLENVSGGDGAIISRMVSFDFNVKKWMTRQIAPTATWKVAAGYERNGVHVLSTTTATAPMGNFYETSTWTHVDTRTSTTSFVPQKLRTPWIHLAGMNGYQRLYSLQLLLTRVTAAGLIAKVFCDWNDVTAVDTKTWTDSEITALTAPIRLEIIPSQSRAAAIMIELQETAPTVGSVGTGEGLRFSSLTVEVGLKGTEKRLASGARK